MKYEYLNMARQSFEPDAIDLNCLINLALVCIRLKKLREASDYLMVVINRCPAQFVKIFQHLLEYCKGKPATDDIKAYIE